MISINDRGIFRREKKIESSGDKDAEYIIHCVRNCTFDRHYKPNEYKLYKKLAKDIIDETYNIKEKAILFDNDGNIILEKTGTINAVYFNEQESIQMKSQYLIHNHPSGLTFSYDDIKMAVDVGLKETIVCTGKGIFYRLSIKDNVNIENIVLQYKKSAKLVKSVLLNLYNQKKINKKEMDKEYGHYIMSVFSNLTEGVTYEKTKH